MHVTHVTRWHVLQVRLYKPTVHPDGQEQVAATVVAIRAVLVPERRVREDTPPDGEALFPVVVVLFLNGQHRSAAMLTEVRVCVVPIHTAEFLHRTIKKTRSSDTK